MLTETQKNFRKQMRDHKKNGAENEEQIFSYIENDMISDYYKIKSKRPYNKSIPVATILLLIIIVGFKIYSYTAVNSLNASTGIPNAINIIKPSNNESIIIQNKKNQYLSDISTFFTDINNLKLKQNEVISRYNSYFADYNNGIVTQKSFIIKIQNLIEQISLINSEFEDIDIIEGTENYYILAKTNIILQNSLFENILLEQKTGDIKYNKEIGDLQAKINLNSNEIRKELLAKFDELGIKYQIDSKDRITYTIEY